MADPAPEPGEPPPGVTSELTWRLAARLFHDHRREPACPDCPNSSVRPVGAAAARCANCRQPWPCSGRRLAELGLNRAVA